MGRYPTTGYVICATLIHQHYLPIVGPSNPHPALIPSPALRISPNSMAFKEHAGIGWILFRAFSRTSTRWNPEGFTDQSLSTSLWEDSLNKARPDRMFHAFYLQFTVNRSYEKMGLMSRDEHRVGYWNQVGHRWRFLTEF